ncbi:hypothetical protein T261_0607 [Streptomyces lydicus]|nr:hypothetical protein T261_0607 [Streptomyces lydicus]
MINLSAHHGSVDPRGRRSHRASRTVDRAAHGGSVARATAAKAHTTPWPRSRATEKSAPVRASSA